MVVHAFPLVKLGIILLQQMSKPVVKLVSNMAVNNNIICTHVCKAANCFHYYDVKIRNSIQCVRKTDKLQILSEKEAIEKGAHLLSELIIFIIASAIAIFQYKKTNNNKDIIDNQIEILRRRIEQLELTLQNKS